MGELNQVNKRELYLFHESDSLTCISLTSGLTASRISLTAAWNLGHRCRCLANRHFMTWSTWKNSRTNESEQSDSYSPCMNSVLLRSRNKRSTWSVP